MWHFVVATFTYGKQCMQLSYREIHWGVLFDLLLAVFGITFSCLSLNNFLFSSKKAVLEVTPYLVTSLDLAFFRTTVVFSSKLFRQSTDNMSNNSNHFSVNSSCSERRLKPERSAGMIFQSDFFRHRERSLYKLHKNKNICKLPLYSQTFQTCISNVQDSPQH